jgi:hypothetical protein
MTDWRTENRILQLERLLDEAVKLLEEFGAWDVVNDVSNEPVAKFLASDELREATS